MSPFFRQGWNLLQLGRVYLFPNILFWIHKTCRNLRCSAILLHLPSVYTFSVLSFPFWYFLIFHIVSCNIVPTCFQRFWWMTTWRALNLILPDLIPLIVSMPLPINMLTTVFISLFMLLTWNNNDMVVSFSFHIAVDEPVVEIFQNCLRQILPLPLVLLKTRQWSVVAVTAALRYLFLIAFLR